MQYPGKTTLYEVARGLLFPSPDEAETYRREAAEGGGGKAKTTTNPSNPDNSTQSNKTPTNHHRTP